MDEQLVYSPHPENPGHTLLKQEAVVLVQGVPLSSYMESLLTSTISANATKVGFETHSFVCERLTEQSTFLNLFLQGRMAIEWVIQKINDEIKDLSTSAVKSTDEFFNHTKKSIDDIAHTAKKSMDDLSSAAKKSLDELLPTATPQQPSPLPKF